MIRFPNTLWVQLGGVKVKNEDGSVAIEGVDEDSYLKVFNHFGRVLRLYTFENDQWVDSATGVAPIALDEKAAGQVAATHHRSSTKPAAAKSTRKKPAVRKKSSAKPAAKPAAKAGAKSTRTKPATRKGAKSPAKVAAKPAAKAGAKSKS